MTRRRIYGTRQNRKVNILKAVGGSNAGSISNKTRKFSTLTIATSMSGVATVVNSAESGVYVYFSRDCIVRAVFRDINPAGSARTIAIAVTCESQTTAPTQQPPSVAASSIEVARGYGVAPSGAGEPAYATYEGLLRAGDKIAAWSGMTSTSTSVAFVVDLISDLEAIGGE